jgi:hypothetical protein
MFEKGSGFLVCLESKVLTDLVSCAAVERIQPEPLVSPARGGVPGNQLSRSWNTIVRILLLLSLLFINGCLLAGRKKKKKRPNAEILALAHLFPFLPFSRRLRSSPEEQAKSVKLMEAKLLRF